MPHFQPPQWYGKTVFILFCYVSAWNGPLGGTEVRTGSSNTASAPCKLAILGARLRFRAPPPFIYPLAPPVAPTADPGGGASATTLLTLTRYDSSATSGTASLSAHRIMSPWLPRHHGREGSSAFVFVTTFSTVFKIVIEIWSFFFLDNKNRTILLGVHKFFPNICPEGGGGEVHGLGSFKASDVFRFAVGNGDLHRDKRGGSEGAFMTHIVSTSALGGTVLRWQMG